jgi:hypothetical protein
LAAGEIQSKFQEKPDPRKHPDKQKKTTTDTFVGAALVDLSSLALNYLMTTFTTRSVPQRPEIINFSQIVFLNVFDIHKSIQKQ